MLSEPTLRLDSIAREDAAGQARYAALLPAYLEQLVAPMDDMWLAFALLGEHHLLYLNDELAGCCALDEEGKLLSFFVHQQHQNRAAMLLSLALTQLRAKAMIVCTLDPSYLSLALDAACSVKPQGLLYALVMDPGSARIEDLELARPADHGALVSFYRSQTGGPLDFLNAYVLERIEREELFHVQGPGSTRAVGELRVDAHQRGIAHLGLIVQEEQRGRGLGTGLLNTLVERARERQLAPHCSTELTNVGAQCAIERAGFRSRHRILRVDFVL